MKKTFHLETPPRLFFLNHEGFLLSKAPESNFHSHRMDTFPPLLHFPLRVR